MSTVFQQPGSDAAGIETPSGVPNWLKHAAEKRLAAVKDSFGLPDETRLVWDTECEEGVAGWVSPYRPLVIHLDGVHTDWYCPYAECDLEQSVQHIVTHEAVHVLQYLRDGRRRALLRIRKAERRAIPHDRIPHEREAIGIAGAFAWDRRNQRVRDRRDRRAGRPVRRPVLPYAEEAVREEYAQRDYESRPHRPRTPRSNPPVNAMLCPRRIPPRLAARVAEVKKRQRRKRFKQSRETLNQRRIYREEVTPHFYDRRPLRRWGRDGRRLPGRAISLEQYVKEATDPASHWPWDTDPRTGARFPADPCYTSREISNVFLRKKTPPPRPWPQQSTEGPDTHDAVLELAAFAAGEGWSDYDDEDAEEASTLLRARAVGRPLSDRRWARALDVAAIARTLVPLILEHRWRDLETHFMRMLFPERYRANALWYIRLIMLGRRLTLRHRSLREEEYRMLDAVLDFASGPGTLPEAAECLVDRVRALRPDYLAHCVQQKAQYEARAAKAAATRQARQQPPEGGDTAAA